MLIQSMITESPRVANPLQTGVKTKKKEKRKKNSSITKSKSVHQSTANYIHVLIARLIKMAYETRRNPLVEINFIFVWKCK